MSKQNNDTRKKLDIPIGSKFPICAGICMTVALLLRVEELFMPGLLTQILLVRQSSMITLISFLSFIIIAFLPRRSIKYFIIPIVIDLLSILVFILVLLEL